MTRKVVGTVVNNTFRREEGALRSEVHEALRCVVRERVLGTGGSAEAAAAEFAARVGSGSGSSRGGAQAAPLQLVPEHKGLVPMDIA